MTLNPPIIDLTQSYIDSGDASEAIAASFKYKLINGESFMAKAISIDIDTVIAKALKDECILAELFELFTNDSVCKITCVNNLNNYFDDHMDESTALLVAAAESGQLE
tara:strand:+ start:602 stop:925 length:324 start_codon:yes stop_codon:yes gene_type:complete